MGLGCKLSVSTEYGPGCTGLGGGQVIFTLCTHNLHPHTAYTHTQPTDIPTTYSHTHTHTHTHTHETGFFTHVQSARNLSFPLALRAYFSRKSGCRCVGACGQGCWVGTTESKCRQEPAQKHEAGSKDHTLSGYKVTKETSCAESRGRGRRMLELGETVLRTSVSALQGPSAWTMVTGLARPM